VDGEASRVSPVASPSVAEGTRVPTTVPVVCRPPTQSRAAVRSVTSAYNASS